MPKGPRGEKRPADVIGNAVIVAKIATGEIVEKPRTVTNFGSPGGKARAKALSPRSSPKLPKRVGGLPRARDLLRLLQTREGPFDVTRVARDGRRD